MVRPGVSYDDQGSGSSLDPFDPTSDQGLAERDNASAADGGVVDDPGSADASQGPGTGDSKVPDAKVPAGCGDGLCGQGEDCQSCVTDCGTCCAGGLCVFPGAEGFGVTTVAGRGGQVIRVTNLNASGSGSLEAAVEAKGPRTIIFDVSGYIKITSDIVISEPFVTIAGQTAPSPGITIRGAAITIKTHDVLIQHIRVRAGDDPGGENHAFQLSGSSVYNVVLDHVSGSWGIDENFSTYGAVKDVTFSNCIVSEALYNAGHPKGGHSKGMLVQAPARNIAILRNLFAHNVDRNPHLNDDTQSVVMNNLIYDPVDDAILDECNNDSEIVISIIGNLQIDGPDTSSSTLVDLPCIDGSAVYEADNVGDQAVDSSGGAIVSSPPLMYAPATILPSGQVKAHVLDHAGARPLDRDAVDARIVSDVQSKTGGIIDSQDEVGGYPPLQQNTNALPLPADHNGDDDGDGYTNLEEWLHELAWQLGG